MTIKQALLWCIKAKIEFEKSWITEGSYSIYMYEAVEKTAPPGALDVENQIVKHLIYSALNDVFNWAEMCDIDTKKMMSDNGLQHLL